MTRQYQRLSAQQWQAFVEQQATSDLSAPKFCQQQNISYASFIKWRQKFSASSAEAKPSSQTGDFVDLSSLAGSGAWNITLCLGNGVELRLSQQ